MDLLLHLLFHGTIFSIVFVSSIDALCNVKGSISGVVELQEWTGTIQSPGFDTGSYPKSQDCRWIIRISKGSQIELTLYELELEKRAFLEDSTIPNKKCIDYVRVYSSDNDLMSETCNTLYANLTLLSTSGYMEVEFHSDENNRARGFAASYKGVCSGTISKEELVTLETPGFPRPPPKGITCSWTVQSSTVRIMVVVRVSGVERHQENKSDYWKLPPRCGRSPFKTTSPELDSERELCLEDAIHAYEMDSIQLVYSEAYDPQPRSITIDTRQPRPLISIVSCQFLCVNHHNNCTEAHSGAMTRGQDPGNDYDYHCFCREGYTGRNCEVKLELVDPCAALKPCHHGSCSNKPDDLGEYLCNCDENYNGTNCDVALTDACTGVSCQNSGVCKVVGTDGFVCICPIHSGFTGQYCNIPIGSAYCSQEQDSIPGSRLYWSDTPVNQPDFQHCPGQALGNATRHCVPDQFSPTGGVWTWPDLSMCVSPQVFQLSLDAMNLLQPTTPLSNSTIMQRPPISISNLTSRLLSVTMPIIYPTANPEKPPLYPGDLLLTADVMTTLSKASERINIYGTKEAMDVTKHFTSAVDNLVDPRTQPTWRNAQVNLVENRLQSVIAATQNLISVMLRRHPKLRLETGTTRRAGQNRMGTNGDVVVSLTVRNIDISVSQLSLNNGSYMFRYNGKSSSVEFSTSILSKENARKDVPVSVYVARFQSLSALLSMKEERYKSSRTLFNSSSPVNSDVVSAAVLYVPEEKFNALQTPIVLTFYLKDPSLKETKMAKCVFMNMNAVSYAERWSSEGCYVARANDTHVVCHCLHLTNFAVLMDVYETQDIIDKDQDIILTYISYIGSVLSILACLICIGTFQYLGLSSDRVRIHQQLGLSIVMVQILFICVGVTGEDHGTPLWGCRLLAILLHYSITAMFCWMLVEGIHIYVVLVRVFKLGSHVKKYSAMGWGMPLIVVGISTAAFLDHYGSDKICWLDHELLLVCFVPTVGLVVLINTLILGIVIRTMMNSNSVAQKVSQVDHSNFSLSVYLKKKKNKNTRMQTGRDESTVPQESSRSNVPPRDQLAKKMRVVISVKATAVLLPLLGLTWVLGFLAVDTGGTHTMTYVFTYLFTLTNSFQGVLFFIFHCLLNVDVHQGFERKYRRRKRLSLAETLSSRTRKLSEPDFYSPHGLLTNSKSTNTTRSTLTNLSLGGDRRSSIKTTDRDPFSNDGFLRLPRFSTGSKLIPEPDYPNSFRRIQQMDNESFQEPQEPKIDSEVSGQGHTANSINGSDTMSLRRNSRNSVRFT